MFNTRGRKIFGDILSRKGRTALVSISIFIGVFGVVTLFSMGNIIVDRLEKDIQADDLAMLKTFVTLSSDEPAPDNATFMADVNAYPGVTTAEGYSVNAYYFRVDDDDKFEEGTLVASYAPIGETQLEPFQLVEGDYPVAGQHQLAIDKRMADANKLEVGDTITLRLVSQADGSGANIPEEVWTVSAIVFQPYMMSFNFDGKTAAFATLEDAQYITGSQSLNTIFTRFVNFKTAESSASEFAGWIVDTTGYIPAVNMTFDPDNNDQIKSAKDTGNVLGMLGLVALIVSGFLVINVVTSIVVEQKRQIGVMKSLGASRWDNFVIYTGIALTYGIIGVIPGVLLGIPMGYLAATALAEENGTFIDKFTVSPSAIVLGILIGLAVPVLASLIPVFNGTRVKILDAMLDLGISSNYGTGRVARTIAKLPLPITIRQGLSNVSQKKSRLALTMITLAIAAGAFMGIFALFSSISDMMDTIVNTYGGTDIYISPSEQQDYDRMRSILLENVDGITAVEPSSGLQIEIDGYEPMAGQGGIFAQGYDPQAEYPAYHLTLTEGSLWAEGTDPYGVVLSVDIAEKLEKHAGDTIVLRGAGQSREVEVVGVSNYPFPNVWMRWQAISEIAGYTVNGEPAPRELSVVMTTEDPTVEQASDKIDEMNEVLLNNGITAQFLNFPEIVAGITNLIRTFQIIFNLTALLIALVGGLGLLTALSMSVFERQKEIGVMRSIGAGSSTVAGQFLTEGLLIGFIAWLVALPISYLLNIMLIQALGFDSFLELKYPISAPIVGLVGMIAITTVSSLWPSISAARRTVSDILRYQ